MTRIIKKIKLTSEKDKVLDKDALKGTQSNPFTQDEFELMKSSNLWTGGYVEGIGYTTSNITVYSDSCIIGESNNSPYTQGLYRFQAGVTGSSGYGYGYGTLKIEGYVATVFCTFDNFSEQCRFGGVVTLLVNNKSQNVFSLSESACSNDKYEVDGC
jgi:hypothetical protein